MRTGFPPRVVPRRWHLNTCLVNFYGDRDEGGKTVDAARVGEHRDFEPGPVASLSLGERARFQFVRRGARDAPPVRTQWLEDNSLQIFGGPRWKDDLLHRVQRVDDKHDLDLPPKIAGFRTRRVNFTFRYVPDEHVVPFAQLPPVARDDIRDYVDDARGALAVLGQDHSTGHAVTGHALPASGMFDSRQAATFTNVFVAVKSTSVARQPR